MSETSSGRPCSALGGVRAGEGLAAEPPPFVGWHSGSEQPRAVTTGRKIDTEPTQEHTPGVDVPDCASGERVNVAATSYEPHVGAQLTPDADARRGTAQIDALAFTVIPPDEESMRWVMAEMQQFLPVDQLEGRSGCFGFKQSVRFGEGAGLIAWGGASQRDRVYFSIQGKGCAMVEDWAGLSVWLRDHRAKIKRADLAYDDFKGESVSISWGIDQYRQGGFNAGGRKPQHHVFGDWLLGEYSTQGRTLGVGNRRSGKYCRIYEKGKQLGDATSLWTRVEVELHDKDRVLPFELLTEPGRYFAGAYPCLAFLSVKQSRIKTIAHSASISFDAAQRHGKQQSGKLVNLMLQVYGGDMVEVVNILRRDGIPARVDQYSYHLADSPELLDRNAPGSFAATGASE